PTPPPLHDPRQTNLTGAAPRRQKSSGPDIVVATRRKREGGSEEFPSAQKIMPKILAEAQTVRPCSQLLLVLNSQVKIAQPRTAPTAHGQKASKMPPRVTGGCANRA